MEKDQKDMISEIIEAFEKYAGHQAFVINNITYTYRQLSETVYKISTLINNREDKIIGIIAEDRLETYASILAVLISGKTYVILHPAYPRHRNRKIAELADIHLILYTKDIRVLNLDTEHIDFICTSELQEVVPSSSGIHSEKNENFHLRQYGRAERSSHLPQQPKCFLQRIQPFGLAIGRERPYAANVRTNL